jgi:ribose transport system ATP-binding protein
VFGAKPGRGRLELPGRTFELTGLNPARAIGAGLALLPRDRAGQAAVLEASAAENITLGNLGQDLVRGRLRYSRSLERAAAAMRDCGVRPVAPRRALRTFSGGNQQKAVLAKWLDRDPAVLLLDEPALGIDLASRTQLFARIRALADGGAAVLVASLDHNDLAALCDTVLVMRGGRIGARLSGGELTPATILARCYPPRSAR